MTETYIQSGSFAAEHHAYLGDWIDGDPKVLSPGRDSFPVQRAFRVSTTRIWVKSSIVENGMVLNQSIDHYGTVLQIASYLLHKGFSVEVNHHDDADIVATLNGHTIAIEYERPGTHTADQLIEKNQRLQTKYGRVVFVVTSTNFKTVAADNCIGIEKKATRGLVLKKYPENLVHEFSRLKPVNQ